jgi:hypothetical protein
MVFDGDLIGTPASGACAVAAVFKSLDLSPQKQVLKTNLYALGPSASTLFDRQKLNGRSMCRNQQVLIFVRF